MGMDQMETELRLGLGLGLGLGLPGNSSSTSNQVIKKRVFSETMDLNLNLTSSSSSSTATSANGNSAASKENKEEDVTHSNDHVKLSSPSAAEKKNLLSPDPDLKQPPAKAQVVGWPPVRSFRKNMLAVQKNMSSTEHHEKEIKLSTGGGAAGATLVKVSVEGAPYLRKIDLKMYKSYNDLSLALTNMFGSFNTKGNCGGQAGIMKDYMNEKKLIIILNGTEYVPTYEDKDGDWMLVGDVPWEMFVESCKRLRMMKGSDAAGLAPSAMEKCKNMKK